MTTVDFANRLTVLGIKIGHLERSRATSCSKPEIAEAFANDLGTLQHVVNELMKARNESGTEVDLCFKLVADW